LAPAPIAPRKMGNGETWLNLREEWVCGPAHRGWQTVAVMAESGVGQSLSVAVGDRGVKGGWRIERGAQAWMRGER
jgi:hypothetical protein